MQTTEKQIIPVILSGGAGTRLWPLSREASPKPFIPLSDGESLLTKTFKRAGAIPKVTDIIVITRADLFWRTQDHFALSGLDDIKVEYLLEPFGRNTAGAVKIAARFAKERFGEDVILLFLSADHLIEDNVKFQHAVASAAHLASGGHLVTFGIIPTHPETAYGYIEQGKAIDESAGFVVSRFVEKPDKATAETFIANGNFLWNAGIFCFTPKTLLAEATRVAPEIVRAVETCITATDLTKFPITLDESTFDKLPDISIDNALMERSKKVVVVPADFDWKDIGSWLSMSGLTNPDEHGNRIHGETFSLHTKNTYINAPDRLVATIGVEDLIIIDTPDALLITHKDRTQDVKKIAQHLKASNHQGYLYHRTVHRPWGTYTILEEGNGFKIKRITVKPGASLSLQSHKHRSEHWVIVSGIAKIVNGDEEIRLNTNESTFVKAGNKHRLSNPGRDTLIMIETQVGGYLGEDDIMRYDDHYGRA